MTDIINLEDLPFPMFETTEEEKEELREALSCPATHLCNRVGSLGMKNKIRKALYPHRILESCLERDDIFGENRHQLRNIWINKLLAYKGE